jgi:hypothetical protein
MNAPDYLSRLRKINGENNSPTGNCINRVKDFTQFVQFAPSAKTINDSGTSEADANGEVPASCCWLIHFVDRDPLPVTCCPALLHAEILGRYPDAIAAEPFTPIIRQPLSPMTVEEEALIRAWLSLIQETESATIADVIERCQQDADARSYFAGRATELPKPDPFPDDRRTCDQCANLIARRCQAAKRGKIVAGRHYEPIHDLPRRCEGYSPGPDDTDRRPGRERWPGLI